MTVYKDGVEIVDAYKMILDTDNYGFVRKSWKAGNYAVFYKQLRWHADDVKDYTFRTHLPVKVDIKLTEFKNDNEYKQALGKLDF